MNVDEAKKLLEQVGARPLPADDQPMLDVVRSRVSRGAELTTRQANWLKRIAGVA